MYSSAPSVVSTPIASNRFLIVPSLSSAARIPFPSATSARAVDSSCCTSMVSSSFEVSADYPRTPPRSVVFAARGRLDPAQQPVDLPQLRLGRGLNRAAADPPSGMDLVPAVGRVIDPRADDL